MIEKNFVKIKQQQWYFEYHKHSENEPTLVLLHEGLGSVAQWKNWPSFLYKKLHMNILVYDRSGYGQSSPVPSDYPFDYLRYEAKTVFPIILNALNLDKIHLFGHSDGGSIALLAAAYHPNRVKSVISEAAHVIIEKISLSGIKSIRKSYDDRIRKALAKYHGEKADWVFYHWADTWLKNEFHSWSMIEELQQIKTPVLAIQGEQDEYGSYQQLELIKKNCSAQLLFLSNCGHHPHFDQKEQVFSEIQNHLNQFID